jgi:hypothetical protein
MNRLPMQKPAQERLDHLVDDYTTRLLDRADIQARRRSGTGIDVGELNEARDHVEFRDKWTQFFSMLAGTGLGIGGAGLVQNLLDEKSTIYMVVFGAIVLVGALATRIAFFRR